MPLVVVAAVVVVMAMVVMMMVMVVATLANTSHHHHHPHHSSSFHGHPCHHRTITFITQGTDGIARSLMAPASVSAEAAPVSSFFPKRCAGMTVGMS